MKNKALVVVDDDKFVVESLKSLFEEMEEDICPQSQLSIYAHTDPRDVIPCISEHDNIIVIVSDHRMPHMTGIELFTDIINQFPSRTIYKVLYTGYCEIEHILKAKQTEGLLDEYVFKTSPTMELIEAVSQGFKLNVS